VFLPSSQMLTFVMAGRNIGNRWEHLFRKVETSEAQICQKVGCGKAFGSKRKLKMHMFQFHKNKICKLPGCFVTFTNPGDLAEHSLTHTRCLYTCDICFNLYLEEESLRRHEEREHPERAQ
jgi:hypothetical protein